MSMSWAVAAGELVEGLRSGLGGRLGDEEAPKEGEFE